MTVKRRVALTNLQISKVVNKLKEDVTANIVSIVARLEAIEHEQAEYKTSKYDAAHDATMSDARYLTIRLKAQMEQLPSIVESLIEKMEVYNFDSDELAEASDLLYSHGIRLNEDTQRIAHLFNPDQIPDVVDD